MSAAHAKLRKHFPGLSPDDEIVEDCSCAYSESTHGVPQQGHLWVTSRHLCFHAKILSRKTQIQLRLEDIKTLEKQNTACVVPNALLVVTKENKKYFFTSLMHRDQTYDAIQRGMPAQEAMQHSEPHAAEPITPPAVSEKDAEAEATTEAKTDEDGEHEQTQRGNEDRHAAQEEAEAKAKTGEEEQQRKEQQEAEALKLRAEEERKLDEARRAKEREEQEEAQKLKQQAQEREREEERQRQAAKRAQEEKEEKERTAAEAKLRAEQEQKAKLEENKKKPELPSATAAVATKPTTESPAVRSTQPKPQQQLQPSGTDLLQRHQVLVVLFAVLLAFVLSRLLF